MQNRHERGRHPSIDVRKCLGAMSMQQFNDWMASDRIETFDEITDKFDDCLKRYLE
jgi:hypothetical protein